MGSASEIGGSTHRVIISMRILLAFVFLLVSGSGYACSTPMYQWALEKWLPDFYDVYVFSNAEQTAAEQALWPKTANVRVTWVRPEKESMSNDVAAIWRRQQNASLPWMVVRYPYAPPHLSDVWAGGYSEQAAREVLDSPGRREVFRRLTGGEAAVFVLLLSGDAEQDAAAETRLRKALENAKAHLQESASKLRSQSGGEMLGYENMRFSYMTLSRNTPAEKFWVAALSRIESDLDTYEEPMAFPVFGRGRVLYTLVGEGIADDMVLEACAFICGACTCLVKAESPGADMLMMGDWMTHAPFSQETAPVATAAPALPKALEKQLAVSGMSLWPMVALGLLGAFLLTAGISWFILRRHRHSDM